MGHRKKLFCSDENHGVVELCCPTGIAEHEANGFLVEGGPTGVYEMLRIGEGWDVNNCGMQK